MQTTGTRVDRARWNDAVGDAPHVRPLRRGALWAHAVAVLAATALLVACGHCDSGDDGRGLGSGAREADAGGVRDTGTGGDGDAGADAVDEDCYRSSFDMFGERDPRFEDANEVHGELDMLLDSSLRIAVATSNPIGFGGRARLVYEDAIVDHVSVARVRRATDEDFYLEAIGEGTTTLTVTRCGGTTRRVVVNVHRAAAWSSAGIQTISPPLSGPVGDLGLFAVSEISDRWLNDTVLIGEDTSLDFVFTPVSAEGRLLRGVANNPDPAFVELASASESDLDHLTFSVGARPAGTTFVVPGPPGSEGADVTFEVVGVDRVASTSLLHWDEGPFETIPDDRLEVVWPCSNPADCAGDTIYSPTVGVVAYAADGRRIYGLTEGLRWDVEHLPGDDDWTDVPRDAAVRYAGTGSPPDGSFFPFLTTFHDAPSVATHLELGFDAMLTIETHNGPRTVIMTVHSGPRPR